MVIRRAPNPARHSSTTCNVGRPGMRFDPAQQYQPVRRAGERERLAALDDGRVVTHRLRQIRCRGS